jgi:hypothetical protein
MTEVRYQKTRCGRCLYQGPRVHANGRIYETCMRHRLDGDAHALSDDWLDALDRDELHCELFRPAIREAA